MDLLNYTTTIGKKNNNTCSILNQVLLQYFNKTKGQNKYKYDYSDSKWIDIECIITNVTLSFNLVNSVYIVNSKNTDALDKFVVNPSEFSSICNFCFDENHN